MNKEPEFLKQMKTRTHLLIFFLLQYTLTFAQFDIPGSDREQIQQQEQTHAAALLGTRSNPATNNYDLKYHRLEWRINPAVRYISGTVTSYFVPKENGFLELNFDLASTLRVTRVIRNGQSLPFSQASGDLLTVTLPQALSAGQLDSVSVTYEGAPAEDGFGSFVQDTHNGQPIIWTLSEPYGAKNWWPCKQDLNDKIDSIDVIVTVPNGNRVASNGLLVEESSTANNGKRFHWKHRYPIPAYLIAIGVTNYAVYSDFVPRADGPPIEVLNYVYPEFLEYAQARTGTTVEIMQLFNELFGLYPFAAEKYGHAMFGFGGGMEHQTMSFMGGFSHLLQAHELAHQWFGDKITCGSWSDIWLNEGFATYLEGITYQYGLGNRTWLDWKAGLIQNITSQPDGSVYVRDTSTVNRIFSGRLSYNKGGMLVHMLRWKLGDEAFFQGVRNYLEDPKLAYGYARTADLKRHLEAAGGQDLTEFFADWLYGEGYPSYQVIWDTDGNRLVIELSQSTSHNSVDFFEMPVPIQVLGTEQDTILRLDHNRQNQRFEFNLDFEALGVVFDPNLEIVSANNLVEQQPVNTRDRFLPENTIRIYPNPAVDQVQFLISDPETIIVRVIIYDNTGRRLRESNNPGRSLSVGDLPSGYYVLLFETNRGVSRRPLIK